MFFKNPLSYFFPIFLVCGTLTSLISCGSKNDSKRFLKKSAEESQIHFANHIVEDTLANIANFAYMYNGGGVAIGDVDNDGLEDIYFTGNQTSGRLYRNLGNLKFEDITQEANIGTDRWGTGVSMVDINADGWLDIYLSATKVDSSRSGSNLFFINNGIDAQGQVTFTESARAMGLDDPGFTVHTTFFDFDRDGDLDIYMLRNHLERFPQNTIRPIIQDGSAKSNDKLFRNESRKPGELPSFVQVTQEAGILTEGYGLGVAVSDLDQDGWPDLYIANDFLSSDQLYMNNANGTFTDRAADYLKHQSRHGMGVDVADYNNDQLADILVMDMLPRDNPRKKQMAGQLTNDYHETALEEGYQPQFIRNTLQLNNGLGDNGTLSFSEIGELADISATDWSWSPLFADFNNDGLKDIFITNGLPHNITDLDYVNYSFNQHYMQKSQSPSAILETVAALPEVAIPNYLYVNQGDLTFADQTEAWGLQEPIIANGAAYADLDRDGDLDIVINVLNQKACVYENQGDSAHFLQIKLKGPAQNPQAIGAKLLVQTSSGTQYLENYPQRGYQSSMGQWHHFGMGQDSIVQKLTVVWPDGTATHRTEEPVNQFMTISWEPEGVHYNLQGSDNETSEPLVKPRTGTFSADDTHSAFRFNDFNYERLLPWRLSNEGPGMAIADVNGDGSDDIYMGADRNHGRQLQLQNSTGGFDTTKINLPAGATGANDMGNLFFDFDNDNDNDLYIVSGGNLAPENDSIYVDRLLENDGHGRFTLTEGIIPKIPSCGSSVSAADFDGDGDLDLFIGARTRPRQFPKTPKSLLLLNEGGRFADASHLLPYNGELGMVTQGLWTDFDDDGKVDLVVVGHLMPITFLKNTGTGFEDHTPNSGIQQFYGLWNSIEGGDFDNDGDTDYVAGNFGENNRFRPSLEQPMEWHVSDYDKNGTPDPIMSYYSEGIRVPVPSRDELIAQLPMMRKRFPNYVSYAKATLEDVLSETERESATRFKANHLSSSYIENLGNGTFRLSSLPLRTQFSSINGLLAQDMNDDEHLDLILVGNTNAPHVHTGSMDASQGLILLGNGRGDFKIPSQEKTGFYIDGEARALGILTSTNGEKQIVATRHNNRPLIFSITQEKKAVPIGPRDYLARIALRNGKVRKQEIYYSQGYLSQNSRKLYPPKDAQNISLKNFQGKTYEIQR